MMIYAVFRGDEALGAYFQEKSAETSIKLFAPDARVVPIEIIDLEASSIGHIIARGGVIPNATQSLLWLTSEVGELADAVVNEQGDWARNNEKERSIPDEAADVLYMLLAFSYASGFSLLEAMFAKMARTAKTWPGL